ncbi:hypothetical protein ACA910_020976 [Epithemia clementina (nom. ined.)]
MENDQDEVPTASWAMWLWLIFVAIVSFWCQATVTEERFVPALNVIANRFRIPDDIAGATLMAAGASSPELFSSFVSLFITHSSLGLGTVFGSEVFNQLIICAGAVYSSKTGNLQLNKAVVIREVFFYALGIVALYFALQDTKPVEGDASGIDHIFIGFGDAVMVFGGYIFYVLVCANMDAVVNFVFSTFASLPFVSSLVPAKKEDGNTNYGSIRHCDIPVGDDLPFLQEASGLIQEPVGNFETVEFCRTKSGGESESDFYFSEERQAAEASASGVSNVSGDVGGGGGSSGGGDSSMGGSRNRQGILEKGIRRTLSKYSDGTSLRPFRFLMSEEKPSDDHGLYDIEENAYEERLSCFMWQRSCFYSKARFATHGWHLRWFSFMHNQVYSVPNRTNADRHRVKYPPFTDVTIDSRRLIIKIVNPAPQNDESINNKTRMKQNDFYLMAPSSPIFERVVGKLSEIVELRRSSQQQDDMAGLLAASPRDASERLDRDEHDFESLIEFPAGGSNLAIVFFFVLFPFRALMHYTVPDVRTMDGAGNPNTSLTTASIAIAMCLVWLIVGSYAMVASLEALAALLDIPDAVIGYTVSAAGTSLPNYVASAVAARNGFGNMAVSNALGSNTFNIMIGLGLPWVLYTSFGTGFEPYNELRNEGIIQGVLIMAAVLLLLVVLLLQSGFVLHMWHGHLFVVCYVAYLVYVIGGVYFW